MTRAPTMIRTILIGLMTLLVVVLGGPAAATAVPPRAAGAGVRAQPAIVTNPCPGNLDALQSPYTYAGNNPIGSADPNGLMPPPDQPEHCGSTQNCPTSGQHSGGSSLCSSSGSWEQTLCGIVGSSPAQGSAPAGPSSVCTAYDFCAGQANPAPSHDTVGHGRHIGYSYSYKEDIGPVSDTGSPEHVMAIFQAAPGSIFPFPVTGCDSFTEGAVCTLHPGPRFANGVGQVSVDTTPTSFTFTVISSEYFDAPGAKISFSVANSNGELYLHQDAVARDTKLLAFLGVKAGYTRLVWDEQAHNLRQRLDVQRPIHWTSPNDLADLVAGNWDSFR